MKLYEEDAKRPLISGEFTNWEPKRMVRIDEYAYALDPDTGKKGLDLFDLLKAKGGRNSPAIQKDLKKMTNSQLENYMLFK